MIEVTFFRDSRNRLSSVFAKGHAGAGAYGEDVVCAAVSAILQAARLGLESHAKVALDATQHSGTLRLRLPEDARDDVAAAAILATAELSIRHIACEHADHVRVSSHIEPG